MKPQPYQYILSTSLSLVIVVSCSLLAQSPAPAPPSGATSPGGAKGTQGTGTTTRTGTTGQRTPGQPTNPPRSGALPNQPTQPAPAQPQPGTAAPITTPGQTTVQPGQATPGQTTTTPSNTTVQPNQTATGSTTRTGTSMPAGSTTLQDGTITSSGTIGGFDGNGFTLQSDASGTGTPVNFLVGESTVFTDFGGNIIPRDRFFRSTMTSRAPAKVFYTRAENGNLVATKVVLSEGLADEPIVSAGTITEVSPGILVIEQPGASDTPIRYVNNKTTNYVNENGESVPPESVKAGTPVRIFYTKVGDTLVASKVEVASKGKSGLPLPPVATEKSTTPAKKD